MALAAFGAKTTSVDYIRNLNNWGVYVAQMNQFFERYDLYLIPATASVAPKNGEVKTPAWQKPILKTLLHAGKAHWLAQGKLVDRIVKENLKMGAIYSTCQYYWAACNVCAFVLE